jgi:1-acyl-sn-glycerol-3-phosphate acyltransferase
MSQQSQFRLLAQRRFAPFFWTQFLGAFNDNIFKTALLTILTYDAISWTTIDVSLLNQLIPALFILPYLAFSASAGQLADKFEKGRVARFVKLLEIIIMALAAYGWMSHQLWVLILAVAGMGVHSTLFGPVKYAYLPQHLLCDELVGGNGLIEMGTFVGILTGQVIGAVLVVQKPYGIEIIAGAAFLVAMIGWLCSLRIPLSPAPAPELTINWNVLTETVRNLRFSSANRPVFLSLLGNSWFWFYGAIVLAQFPLYAKNYLHGDYSVFVLLLTIFSVGIGAGSLLCEKLSGHKVEIGLVPFGSIGLSIFGIELYFSSLAYLPTTSTSVLDMLGFIAQPGSLHILFSIVMLGIFGGLYVVPLFALIQTRCDPKHMSRTIAGMNILNALFIVVSALAATVMLHYGLTIPQIFLATAILNAFVAFYIYRLVPEFLLRFFAWVLIHTLYRIRGVNTDTLPKEGAAVLVCNHVSYMDALVILAFSPRPIRFVMDHRIFKTPVISWIFKTGKAIPIAPYKEDPWITEKAYVDIAQALHEGELVCIFPEGKLTSTGELNEFKGGIMKILERSPVAVFPIALRGLWGSFFSRDKLNLFERHLKRGPFSKLEIVVGLPLTANEVSTQRLQQEVNQLRGSWK